MLRILCGDALGKLRELPDESVHCCVTSPPYWGLRDYSVAGQLGLEKTPEEYVGKIVEIFREVKRVLRKDGTLWLNLGDSYAGGGNNQGNNSPIFDKQASNAGTTGQVGCRDIPVGLKPKDLCGIPWRVAFALQADGWWLRSDIIWAKPNPMPESCTDRPIKSHEYLFLLSKSAHYFYDAEAIKERGIIPEGTLGAKGSEERFSMNGVNSRPPAYKVYDGQRNKRSVWTVEDDKQVALWLAENEPEAWERFRQESRNKKDVWKVATEPYPEAHFATYPSDLIKPCILAGCPVDGMVLDPFAGSGTTGAVALELGRRAILIELSPKYVELIRQRCDVTPGLALA